MHLVVFYTFNYHREAELNMLRLSIYSIYKELNDKCQLEIRLYTETPEIKNKIEIPIKIIEISRESLQFNIGIYTNGIHDFICHTRVALLPKIIREDIDVCIYLDNDTLLLRGFSDMVLNGLTKLEEPLSYCIESYPVAYFMKNEKEKLREMAKSKHELTKYLARPNVNNGLLIFPKKSTEFIDRLYNEYINFLDKFGHIWTLDMLMLDLVFYETKLTPKKNTINNNKNLSSLYHYFDGKNGFREFFNIYFGRLKYEFNDQPYFKAEEISNSSNRITSKSEKTLPIFLPEDLATLIYGVIYEPKLITGITYNAIPGVIKSVKDTGSYLGNLISMLKSIYNGGFCSYPGFKIKEIKEEMRKAKAGVLVENNQILLFSSSKKNSEVKKFTEFLIKFSEENPKFIHIGDINDKKHPGYVYNVSTILTEFIKIPNSIIYPIEYIDHLCYINE